MLCSHHIAVGLYFTKANTCHCLIPAAKSSFSVSCASFKACLTGQACCEYDGVVQVAARCRRCASHADHAVKAGVKTFLPKSSAAEAYFDFCALRCHYRQSYWDALRRRCVHTPANKTNPMQCTLCVKTYGHLNVWSMTHCQRCVTNRSTACQMNCPATWLCCNLSVEVKTCTRRHA